MKITITGGAGFIGGHVKRYAEELGHEVVTFDLRSGQDIMGDLSDMADSDAVIHLAGLVGSHELFGYIEDAVKINVLGTTRIAQFCSDNDIQLTLVNTPDAFDSIYNATKVGAQRIADAMNKAGMLKMSSLTVFNAFGTNHHTADPSRRLPRKFTPTWATAAWNNEPIKIWGDGSHLICPISTEEVARIFVEATQFNDGQVFDAGIDQAFTVREIAEFFLKHTGSTGGIEYEPMRIGETNRNIAATGRGWELLTRPPVFSWQQLADTIDWYKDQVD